MKEQEWLACADPEKMVQYIRTGKRASPRKLRLFAVACVHRLWHVLEDARCRTAVEVGERFAEGRASSAERNLAFRAACKARDEHPDPMFHTADDKSFAYYAACFAAAAHAPTACFNCSRSTLHHFQSKAPDQLPEERAHQLQLLHEVFGNPFQRITLDPAWLTPAVRAIGEAVYDERRFDDLPILADALEDAGCADRVVLHHCRRPGLHVRGCWLLDLALAREQLQERKKE